MEYGAAVTINFDFRRVMKKLAFLYIAVFCVVSLHSAEGTWFVERGAGKELLGTPDQNGLVSAKVKMPGASALLYREAKRVSFRHSKDDFGRSELVMEVMAGNAKSPLKAWLFVKDKDGLWYQTEREYKLNPGEWTTLRVRLDEVGRNLLPVGHYGVWNAHTAAAIFCAGVSVYGDDAQEVELSCRRLALEGERTVPDLKIKDWNLPSKCGMYEMIESRFELSREYFNPFDPDEITVDFEIYQGEGREPLRYPAFFGQDFVRMRHFTKEMLLPRGKPYWAFRFTPQNLGKCQLRIRVLDRSGKEPLEMFSPWRTVESVPSDSKGFVRRSELNPRYFEFSNGEFFYPIGLNIHTNIDIRTEYRFNLGHRPDQGTFDYDMYFEACGKGGINMVEVWMASWTVAIEWDSSRAYYYGTGRYNMANAWRLDHIFSMAKKNGIYINLVLDAHGKLATVNDQEWDNHPYNSKAAFAEANGGMIAESRDFWTDERAIKANNTRNRYIMARWGAEPNMFCVEYVSEVDLVADAKKLFEEGLMGKWHTDASEFVYAHDQGKHLQSTHICGSYGAIKRMESLLAFTPRFTHIANDAYRSPNILIVDHMRRHGETVAEYCKPTLILEYGGTSQGSSDSAVRADVHAGIWGSIFARQAGSPLLWWHDFIHTQDLYPHFLAFSKFIRDIDMRNRGYEPYFAEQNVTRSADPGKYSGFNYGLLRNPGAARSFELNRTLAEKNKLMYVPDYLMWPCKQDVFEALAVMLGTTEAHIWIYDREKMLRYPDVFADMRVENSVTFHLSLPLEKGDYLLRFYDTLSGEVISSQYIRYDGFPLPIPVDPFRADIAVKLNKVGSVKGGTAK